MMIDMRKENNSPLKFGKFMKRYISLKVIFVLALIIFAGITIFVLYKCTENRFDVYSDNKINITPAQITALKETGEWEFLSIEDEEIIDTLRKNWLKDDGLIRIYYGTLRLGFNMNDVKDDWISSHDDTIKVVLPEIRLLDENFIDEARTKSFYQSGYWSDDDRALMLTSAKEKMKARGLSAENIKTAENNAKAQIKKMIENIIGNNTHIVISIGR